MSNQITVIKRDGSREPLQIEKIQKQIEKACEGIAEVYPSMVEIRAQIEFYDGITTTSIDKLIINAAVGLINDPDVGNHNYQIVAGRLKNNVLRKEVYGQYEPTRLYELVKANIIKGFYTTELLEWFTETEWDELESYIDYEKDNNYVHSAIEQLAEKYLVKDRFTKKILEVPQVRYMIAAATAMFNEDRATRMQSIRDYYDLASDGHFTLATPVLAGLGTKTKQFSSCVLIRSGDSLDSIYAAGEIMGKYAAKRAGIGMEVGRLRPLGSPIRGGEVLHTGLVPFMKKWFGDLRCCSQGGIRNASATFFYPIWHYQFDDLIVLKNNQGTEETRVRHLDYGVVMNAFFWKRFKKKKNVTLFDPNQVPDLYEAFYRDTDEFVKLYLEYEQRTDLRKKTISAEEVISAGLLKERSDTGRIYIVNIDNVMNQGPLDTHIHPIYQSNLCMEILQHTRSFESITDEAGRIALCTLGSINWGKYKHPHELKRACYTLVRSLSNLLGYQDFLSIHSRLHNKEFEPLGIGITNLAYWHAKRGLKYGEADALKEVKRWMEHQAFYLTEASVQLAKERGACEMSSKTYYGKGVFPWERRAKGVNELTDFTPELNWEPLRADMLKYGIRNATLMAVAPVESSSVVIGSTNGIALPMELISVKESKGGSLIQVVPEYQKLKNKYQLLWDQKDCAGYLKTAAVLAAYIDQSLSTDTFYNPAHFPKGKIPRTLVARNLMLAHHWGLKTLYYSLINKTGIKEDSTDANVGVATNSVVPNIDEDDQDYCESCVL